MLSNKSFVVCNKNETSSRKFIIVNWLQQGTVNASILFNIFIYELLNSIDNIIGFAHDVIIYHSDNKIEEINRELQKHFNLVEKYAIDCNNTIPSPCWKMQL